MASCSLRHGAIEAGALPPPDGEQLAQAFIGDINRPRQSGPLPPVPRDPALDELARRGLQLIEAGLPDGVSALAHVSAVAELPPDLQYGIGFEEDTAGIDDLLREAGRRRGGTEMSELLLAGDAALDGIGWAAAGPWVVIVLRARALGPADGPALQAALEAGIRRARPALHPDPNLASIAADVVADGLFDADDSASFGRAGGVPVHLWNVQRGPHLPTSFLNNSLADEGPGSLREAWLTQVGVVAKVTERGTVMILVVATGEADRAALTAELAAAESKATELVNRSRAEDGLPAVRLDGALVAAARQWVAEASRRGCFVGSTGRGGCAGPAPQGADEWYWNRSVWFSGEEAFTWNLSASEGADLHKRFGAAAALAPDGTVWAMVAFAA